MALTLFLLKVSNLDLPRSKSEPSADNDDQLSVDTSTSQLVADENLILLCAKVTFRGLDLWSNNVPVRQGNANFIARGNKPNKFHYNLASDLMPDDQLHLEFHTVTSKRKRKKIVAVFDLMLESLIEVKYIDLPGENLSDPKNSLLESTVQLKVYYTPPDIAERNAKLGIGAEGELVDWKNLFDDEGRHGGHRYRHTYSKHDKTLRKFRRKFVGRTDDADTDSHSDSDFDADEGIEGTSRLIDEKEKLKVDFNNIELLEKSLGRYEGNPYELTEWQIMVHVIQARDLPGLELNPYISVQIDQQKRYTNIQKSSNSPYYGEFFTFDFTLPATQMMEKVIFFRIHHAQKIISKFTDTKPIAIFRLDVATVYNEKEHAFERKWAQLINPDSIESPCGHLLASIAVAERGMPSKNVLGEFGQDDEEFKPWKTLIPAAMPRRLFPVQLKVILFSAMELPEMMTDFLASVSKKILQSETWEPVDPYVEVTYNTMQATTSHRNGMTPVWSEAIYLVGRFPPLIRTIKVALKDHAAVQQDRVIASFLIDLFQISESNPSAGFLPTFGPTWVFLYGSPREYSVSKDQDGLSQGMGEGVCYKGRLLMAIECHPVNGDNTSNMKVQRESGVQFPPASVFPMKRTFVLFGCIYDVTMIDKSFGNGTVCFELSIGSSGYLNPNQLVQAMHNPVSSMTRAYPRVPIDNNKQQFRLPIDLQKPILFTKYSFHDYIYRMTLSNRFKHAADEMFKKIREFECLMTSKEPIEVLANHYRAMEHYLHTLPCGCAEQATTSTGGFGTTPTVHPTIHELLKSTLPGVKLNHLDVRRRKKLLHNIESLKSWISKEIDFDQSRQYEIIKELQKIARALRQMALDAQPSLPDIFLWMICDSKRVAYARLSPEDLLFNLCEGEKGCHNGRVQTLFLKTPRTTDKPVKASSNAKVQIFLWLGIEEYEPYLLKQLPRGFEIPSLPLKPDAKHLQYQSRLFFELRCYCCKARSLIALDDTGLSDPYLSITVGNETQTTPILKQSLCPQWNVTLAFRNLMHVASREAAEEIIGNVVVECYDYDESGDGPDLIGRFSTTAKLDRFKNTEPGTAFQWYEFKFGEKQAGELLAVFELIEVDPETRRAESAIELEEIPLTLDLYPAEAFVTKLMKNPIYRIPDQIMPKMKTYEIEIMFWGLRECRSINLQSIQQAEVSIECAGARITRTITDVQKNPNFESSNDVADRYKLFVNLPDDNNFWPYMSILCVQNRLFGMTEIVGNLVVTDLQQYLISPSIVQDVLANIADLAKNTSYDFNRVRHSVVEAYEATLTSKDHNLGKEKLVKFENEAGHDRRSSDSQAAIINRDGNDNKEAPPDRAPTDRPDSPTIEENRPLTTLEKLKQYEMEKTAGWWSKYYASKAKLRLAHLSKPNMDEGLKDSYDVYADFFDDQSKVATRSRWNVWGKAKKIFVKAGKTRKELQRRAVEKLEHHQSQSAIDESLNLIETDHLKELTLLQTFDIVETELEQVEEYENFNDCLETFPLYKGKGASRSDEVGDDKRIYAKFKGKLRIREISDVSSVDVRRLSLNPALFNTQVNSMRPGATATHQQMLQFDFNKNPITLKCRLYVVKALIYRAWDRSGKSDPFIKIALNNETIIDDVKGKLQNTLEPIFGRSYEFEAKLPIQSVLTIQLWDWDMTSSNDLIAETKIDIENRWFSCHRATCGLATRYDSAGYNAWRDTKKPTIILSELCRTTETDAPVYSTDFRWVSVGSERFDCDPECVEFISSRKSSTEMSHRKVHHESPEDYVRQNTALAALHGWGKKINPKCALVSEHIECRSLFNPSHPSTEQGKLEMWLDFFPMSRPPSSSPIDITPLKPISYQLRLTVWNTSDVELNDENFITGEKTSDIYVKAWILSETMDVQQTDIHYRSLTGEGNFNWRMVFDFDYLDIEEKVVYEAKDSVFQLGNTLKKIPPRLVIRIYDADLLSADDFLGEAVLNLTHLPLGGKTSKKCKADILLNPKHQSLNLFVNKRIAGWWPLIAPAKATEIRDTTLLGGKLEAEISLVTKEEAEQNPVGKAREAPQPLDEPNRPKTSFLWFTSPWKTFRYVIWRNFKWPIIIGVIIFIFVVFLLLALWTVPGEVIRQISNKIFKTNG